ncbi:hypothetical protein GCM10008949_31180 [Deinococcus humi]|nr:hypothetical protein GCM10008949_31180 [Deinococcus humi]
MVILHDQVVIWWSDIDLTRLHGLSVQGMTDGEWTDSVEDVRKQAGKVTRDVKDDEDGGWEIAGQSTQQRLEHRNATRRGSHHDKWQLRHEDSVLRGDSGRGSEDLPFRNF